MAKKNKKLVIPPVARDPHVLYENAVQGVEGQLDLMERIYRKRRGRRFTRLREDFCGTAQLACAWVQRRAQNRAWGVDIHQPTLDWCVQNNVPHLPEAGRRLALVCEDVRTVSTPPVDMVCAYNFSYYCFKQRDELRDYFKTIRAALASGGVIMIDAYGGPTSHEDVVEKRKVKDGVAPDGTPIPTYRYIWEQVNYNPITHGVTCYIHFKLADGSKIKRTFVYDWRLWTLPELFEILQEAGFKDPEVYMQGWDEDAEEPDGVFRRRTTYEGWDSWFGYIAAYK
jgi:SAM-dependent methyltransferase